MVSAAFSAASGGSAASVGDELASAWNATVTSDLPASAAAALSITGRRVAAPTGAYATAVSSRTSRLATSPPRAPAPRARWTSPWPSSTSLRCPALATSSASNRKRRTEGGVTGAAVPRGAAGLVSRHEQLRGRRGGRTRAPRHPRRGGARARRRPPPRHRREEGVASAEDAAKEQEAELEENRDPQVKMPHGSGHCRRGEEPGRRHRGGE
ncbi:hypothetical protein PVAP13_4NG116300 [Panicum virgatum]|uniref:Uncharacterized protein n=1 Tax=Panicum virgatum TaxID=38727 RepID=A0A8T0T712_PANVG|nr:hypothetical protein PVAP13_4NG116300 [Panicum virgatum]